MPPIINDLGTKSKTVAVLKFAATGVALPTARVFVGVVWHILKGIWPGMVAAWDGFYASVWLPAMADVKDAWATLRGTSAPAAASTTTPAAKS